MNLLWSDLNTKRRDHVLGFRIHGIGGIPYPNQLLINVPLETNTKNWISTLLQESLVAQKSDSVFCMSEWKNVIGMKK